MNESNPKAPAPLFLYLASCKMSPVALKKVESAGYIAIEVQAFDDVKIVEPLAIGSISIASKAALECIATSTWSGTVENFGRKVAKGLSQL